LKTLSLTQLKLWGTEVGKKITRRSRSVKNGPYHGPV